MLRTIVRAVGIARVIVDDGNYETIDVQMSARGWMKTIAETVDGVQRLYRLPPGTYWKLEPTDLQEIRLETRAAIKDADAIGARLIVVAGQASWDGLPMIDEG